MENKRIYTLYMHTCLENNKKYIGITRNSVNKRWDCGRGYITQPLFYRAIQKYGWDGFIHEIVLQNLTKLEAEMFEVEMIRYYKVQNSNFGYNIANGGNCQESVSDSTRIKMSQSAKNRTDKRGHIPGLFSHKYEIKIQISKTMKEKKINIGEKNPMYGKKSPNRRKVICIETEIIYDSLKESQEKTGIQFKNIQKVCKGERKTAGGYHWKYVD